MIYHEWEIGGPGFPYGLTVVYGFYHGQVLEVVINNLGNFQQEVAAVGSRGFAPRRESSVGRIQSQLNVFFA